LRFAFPDQRSWGQKLGTVTIEVLAAALDSGGCTVKSRRRRRHAGYYREKAASFVVAALWAASDGTPSGREESTPMEKIGTPMERIEILTAAGKM
jgi:hypothetical protein